MAGYSVVVTNAYGSATSSNALLTLWPLLGWGRNDYAPGGHPRRGLSNVKTMCRRVIPQPGAAGRWDGEGLGSWHHQHRASRPTMANQWSRRD